MIGAFPLGRNYAGWTNSMFQPGAREAPEVQVNC